MVAALILAAGRSTRMGRPKAFLPHFSAENTFLAHLFSAAHMAGASPVVVVGRPEDDRLREAGHVLGGRYAENPEPDRGQLSSILAGLATFGDELPDALIVMPVDVPLITATVVRRLIDAARSTEASIVRAAYGREHGHPVLFKRAVFDELRRADDSEGARVVVRADPGRVLDVETSEPGVLIDVDTPGDYLRVFGRTLAP